MRSIAKTASHNGFDAVVRSFILMLCFACVPVFAQSFADGVAARNRGDFAGAFVIFKQQAVAGDPESQFELALLYSSGKGVNANAKESMYWLKQAATRGHVQAQSNLGVAFSMGRGIPQDAIKAATWFIIAARSGDPVAMTNRNLALKKLTPKQGERAQALAELCLQGNYRDCL
jgi:TPR repeat protein